MNLKRQLLLVSLLTLVLPWAGCEFIRKTETALRETQQQMLSGTARAVAESLGRYPEEFPPGVGAGHLYGDQLYGHRLDMQPAIDGYFDDWPLEPDSLRTIRGTDGPIRFAIGLYDRWAFLYAEVSDRKIVYATPSTLALDDGPEYADRVMLVSANPPILSETIVFAAEAPGPIVTYIRTTFGFAPEPTVQARWQDVPGGYHIEARIPANLLGTHLGVTVVNTSSANDAGIRSSSFIAQVPGLFATISPYLTEIAGNLVQRGMRMIVTDHGGWRIAVVGDPGIAPEQAQGPVSSWLRVAYNALVEPGTEPAFAEPDPTGREQQPYIVTALNGKRSASWFRSQESGRAIVAVAEPVSSDGATIGTVVLQQGTNAILSLTNQGLARLMNVTIITTLLVAAALLGYATWLSRRIRRLSVAAEDALDNDDLRKELPSGDSGDEVGDLSRSFSHVLSQLADYNDYLRSLASKLSHELRTPLAIVTSSLENLEHETLTEASASYTARAKDGADRLRRILSAMSEASRVEELMEHAEAEPFDLRAVLDSTVSAYRDVYDNRRFAFDSELDEAIVMGSPELVIQMLDKLVDNAADFSLDNDVITISLGLDGSDFVLGVHNPGPPLPERMRTQLFDSMVSVRSGGDNKHLGLGLYVAKLIAEGHGGRITAGNTDDGVRFSVSVPVADSNGH
ncbi:MAG: HAMP domain-containing protein [Woeseiaceae bacterium]|nr:HAMP domain-containing protein [Woeseiaceae bacterium]